jgi:hypothetical protein
VCIIYADRQIAPVCLQIAKAAKSAAPQLKMNANARALAKILQAQSSEVFDVNKISLYW